MHKVFISYHHKKNQYYKEELLRLNDKYKLLYGTPIFIDSSVDTDDIPENLPDEKIREKIRDDYLQDSTVTILLMGTETKNRKHIDWELYSSMYNGKINKQSGILVVNLPMIEALSSIKVGHEEQNLYPEFSGLWGDFKTRREYEQNHPYMPERMIDNLLNPDAKISVTHWSKIIDPRVLKFLIDITFENRLNCKYDLSKPMRRQNFNPSYNMSFLDL